MTAAVTARKNYSRTKVVWISGFIVFIAGIPAALSSSALEDYKIFGLTVFDASDFLVSNILLPGGCLLMALFIGIKMDRPLMKQEFSYGNNLSSRTFQLWFQIMRWVVPVTIIIVFLNSLGLI